MRQIFMVVTMSLLLGVCISQSGSRRAWAQEDTLKPRPKQQVTADDANAEKDGPSTKQFLFGQQHITTPCDLAETPGGARIVASAPNPPAYSVLRLDSITLSRAELPALSMRNVQAWVEVTGADTETWSVQLCAQAGAATEGDATALLRQFKLTQKGEWLELSAPAQLPEQSGAAYVRIQAPRDAPVTISGKSPISVYGMSAPVKVSTTHARLTVADTTGDVEADIKPDSGMIDFLGNRGHVRLNADWELNLVISAQQFTGDLEGTARGRIHVLLQPGFLSPFEAVVNHDSDFDCRASICDQVRRADRGGKVAFTYGSGEPVLRLVSANGPVVINSTDRLPTEKDRRAELEAKSKAAREAAIRMNELAGRIHSEADARELTDAIAKQFADSLPSEWVAERIRNRIAHAEYEGVVDPWRLISEQRLADVWNEYVQEIGAPDEALVNAAEIHNMRDADQGAAEFMWTKGYQSIWTMPNIFAMGADGKIAGSCRALEALRVFFELDDEFMNVLSARERVKMGVLASDSFKMLQKQPKSGQPTRGVLQASVVKNPVGAAERAYLLKNGAKAFDQLLERLLNELLSK
jgi:hypothetical protein